MFPSNARSVTVVEPVRVDPTGRSGPTRGQAAGPHWRGIGRGLYVPAHVSATDPDQRVYEASRFLPDYGGLTGWAALRWGGATYFDGVADDGDLRPVPLAVEHSDIRPRPGLLVTSERLAPRDLMWVGGLHTTTHVRSVGFEMRYASTLWHAVEAFDMAARDDLVSIEEMHSYAASLNGWTGIPQCREALTLVDENSWSPMESVMRLYWELICGFPHPLCNHPVFDRDGQHLGTPDILDAETGVVGEYDGRGHLDGHRRARDLQREAAFRRVGLEYVTMVAGDSLAPYATIVPRMVEARLRAEARRTAVPGWTVEPPPWWTPTTTVDSRRALNDAERARMLRYRAS